jgi:hypothetical protein
MEDVLWRQMAEVHWNVKLTIHLSLM